MARKTEGDLFDLVKSLTKGEKRSFKQIANYSSSSEKKYLHLFEMIDSQNLYNEEVIIQKLKKDNILTPLPVLKIYLQKLIFTSLRFYHRGKTIDGQLMDLFADIQICHRKGLKKLRDKMFGKAKYLSNRYEKYEAALFLCEKEFVFKAIEYKPAILEHKSKLLQRIVEKEKHQKLFVETYKLYQKGEIRSKNMKMKWAKLLNDPLLNLKRFPEGYEESFYYYFVLEAYFTKIGNFERAAAMHELITNRMESNPVLLRESIMRYIANQGNLISSMLRIKNIKKAKEAMNKLIKMQQWELNDAVKRRLNKSIIQGYSNLIHGLICINQFNELALATTQAEIFIQTNQSEPYNKSVFYSNLTYAYLIAGNYTKALVCINIVLKEPASSYHEDVPTTAKILNLIIHYELGHDELLPYLLRSTYRFLHQRKRLYKTEDAILRFIRNKLPKANSRSELIEFFKKFKAELEIITQDPYEAKALEYFDYLSWLESKIEKRPFAQIVKEKARIIR